MSLDVGRYPGSLHLAGASLPPAYRRLVFTTSMSGLGVSGRLVGRYADRLVRRGGAERVRDEGVDLLEVLGGTEDPAADQDHGEQDDAGDQRLRPLLRDERDRLGLVAGPERGRGRVTGRRRAEPRTAELRRALRLFRAGADPRGRARSAVPTARTAGRPAWGVARASSRPRRRAGSVLPWARTWTPALRPCFPASPQYRAHPVPPKVR